VEAPPGSPLPGLSVEAAARFTAGLEAFDRAFTPEEGLGPLFNQTRCSSCHDLPTRGGHGAEPVRKATRWDDAVGCDLLADGGGDLLQAAVTQAGRAAGLGPEQTPRGATAVADVHAPPLYGLGLVAAVPIEAVAARADPDDADGDGISGRLGTATTGGVGLFGRKGTHASLHAFVEEATRGEMGLTTPGHPEELRPAGAALPAGVDPAADPEVDETFLRALVDYVRLLAVPPAGVPGSPEERAEAARGERTFTEVGCAACHTPTWTTGADAPEVLRRKRFRAYSDFLLHDLGADLADVCAVGASPSEWRTPRLVGLTLRSVFLHDGRAQRFEDAILLHGGEAARARDAFRTLSPAGRHDLLRFLETL
jgi:CxxC motif-containing protein (DUF1111 family)